MHRFTRRGFSLAAITAVLFLGGVAVAIGAATDTGTVSVCATATVAPQTISDNGSPIATVPGDSSTQCATTTYTIPTATTGSTTTAPTTTTTPTTTASQPTSYDQAISYTQNPPAFTVQRDVPVSTASGLQSAVASIQCGDYVHATAPITISSEWEITAAPSCPAKIDLSNVTMAYTGSSAFPSVWINGAANLQIFGGDIHGPAAGQPGAGGISVYTARNILWWGFHVHDVAHDGLDLFPIGGAINGCDFQGEINNWGGYIADDPHGTSGGEYGTGFHGANIGDAGTDIVTNTRVALYVHDGPTGAGIEIGSGSISGDISGDTIYEKAVNLTKQATSQVAGNAIQWWGAIPIHITIPYIEGDNLQGRVADGEGVYSGVSMSGIDVQYGRATNTNLNPYLAQTEGGISPGEPWDQRHGEVYGDVNEPAPAPATTTAATTTAPTTTVVTTTAPTTTTAATYSFQANFDAGNAQPFNQIACSNYQTATSADLGPFYVKQPGGEGAYYGQYSIPADTSIKQRCQTVDTSRPTTFNAAEYFGLMVWVPSTWAPGPAPAWGPTIGELNYQLSLSNNSAKALALNLQSDHVTIVMTTGHINTSGTIFPNQEDADHSKCMGVFQTTNQCAVYAIPPGKLVKGAWNEIVVGDYFTTSNSGWVKAWYRPVGGAWTQSASISGVPTLLYDDTHDGSGNSLDAIGLYRANDSVPLTIGLDDFTRSASLAAAEASMP